ncbi:MAG: hypothetical protein GX758_04265 [Tenericutes bacterium]|nr:hypothetical protein [Mycoplasmatota bacterium]
MKKTGLFKIIMFMLLGIVVLTWLIGASYFDAGELSALGMYRVGFFDFFQLLFGAYEFSYFLQILIFLVSVGALYGVLGKTGKYRALIDKTASKLKGREFIFVTVISVFIAALTSVFDYNLLLFIFIPAIISIILALGYDKITALLSTFGAMLIGVIGSTISYTITGTINDQLEITKLSVGLYYKLGILAFSIIALVFYLYKAKAKKGKKEEVDSDEEDMFLGEKISNKYSVAPIIVVFSVLFVLLILACTNWEGTFAVDAFSKMHTSIMEFSIKDFTIFAYLFGTVNSFGNWFYAEMAVMSLLSALVLGRFYRMKHSEVLKNMTDGAKKMLQPALLVVLAYTVVYFAGNTMFFPTIADFLINATSKFNVFFSSLVVILGSVLHVDILYLANYVIPQLASQNVSSTVIAILVQSLYGVTMFVAPTSVALVLGLSYLNVPYTQWIKKVWKLVVALLVISFVAIILAMVI